MNLLLPFGTSPNMHFKNILIIADIEGSSCCWSYRASSFMTKAWRHACDGMTQDVNQVVKGLFDSGVRHIMVKDFHRTGYNIIPELVDPRAQVISGYRLRPVPGIGDPQDAEAIIFIEAADIHQLYSDLIRLCYLTPLMKKMIPFWIFLFDLWGRIGLAWVRRWLMRSAG